jgi:Ca2+-binding EF-hand superfamily protein
MVSSCFFIDSTAELVFHIYDTNNDGEIDRREMEVLLSEVYMKDFSDSSGTSTTNNPQR